MSWTHAMCQSCWEARDPNRVPLRLTFPDDETCCYCGRFTFSGIVVRDDPAEAPCDGAHCED